MAVKVIAHTPVFKMPMTVPFRVVLCSVTDEEGKLKKFVTWREAFSQEDGKTHAGYDQGHYFPVGPHLGIAETFRKAWEDYSERSASLMDYVLGDGNLKDSPSEVRGTYLYDF